MIKAACHTIISFLFFLILAFIKPESVSAQYYYPPQMQNVTINSPVVYADGSSQYTITAVSYDPNGGTDIANHNVQINGGSDVRGLFAWSSNNFPWWGGAGTLKAGSYKVCTGYGGAAGIYGNASWNPQYMELDSCNSQVVSTYYLVTTFVVRFNTNFTTPANNTLWGFTSDSVNYFDGWYQYQGFTLGNYAPVLQYVTIDQPTVVANGVSQYAITMVATDSNGGEDIYDQLSLINFQGTNNGLYRGYLAWSKPGNFVHFGGAYVEVVRNCFNPYTGNSADGYAGIYGYGWGNEYTNVQSCVSYTSGVYRVTTLYVTFDPIFTTPVLGNTCSGYVSDSKYAFDGWREYGCFNLQNTAPVMGNVTMLPQYIQADGSTIGTVTITGSDANGGVDIGDQLVLINYQGAKAGNYRGLFIWSDRSFGLWGGLNGGQFKAGSAVNCNVGQAAIYYTYGPEYLTLVPGGCSTSVSGNVRTTTIQIRLDPSWETIGPWVNNTFSGLLYDRQNYFDGWYARGTFNVHVVIRGRVTNTSTGAGINEVNINPGNVCGSWAATTANIPGLGDGYFTYRFPGGTGLCIRPQIPATYTNLRVTNGPADGQTANPSSYECQILGDYQEGCPGFVRDITADTDYNFTLDPLPSRTLQGNIYIDTSYNACASGASTYPGAGTVTANSSSLPPASGNISSGGYSVSALSGNNYSATLAGISSGYTVRGIRNASSGAFTNHSGFTYNPGSPNIDLTSNRILDWCLTNIRPWMLTGDGDIRIPSLVFPLPVGTTSSPVTLPSNGLPAYYSSSANASFGSGTANGFVINNEYSFNSDSSNKQGLFSYTFFMNRAKIKAVPVNNLVGTTGVTCTGNTCSISNLPTGIYHFPNVGTGTGNLTITSYTQAPGAHVLLLVNGDVMIGDPSTLNANNLKVPAGVGNLFIVAAKNDINFPAGVGSTAAVPCGNSTCSNIEGIYSAERHITLQSNASCPATVDKQFTMAGNFIANALKPLKTGGVGKFRNFRTLCNGDQTYPVFVVQTRYDFIPQLTDFYKVPSVRWKELNP